MATNPTYDLLDTKLVMNYKIISIFCDPISQLNFIDVFLSLLLFITREKVAYYIGNIGLVFCILQKFISYIFFI
jgi:hypothetical protein